MVIEICALNYRIAGINWVAAEAAGKPSVASMSLGGGTSNSVDDAVRAVRVEWGYRRGGSTTDE